MERFQISPGGLLQEESGQAEVLGGGDGVQGRRRPHFSAH